MNSKPKPSSRSSLASIYTSTILKADPTLCHISIRLAIVRMVDCEIAEGINRFKISKAAGLKYYAVLKQFNDDLIKQKGLL